MKKILKFLVVIAILVTLCGCGKKEALTDKELKDKLSNMGFNLHDITDSMEDSNISVVRTANNRKYQIEYYVFKSADTAKTAYENNMKMFEENKKYKGKKKSNDNYNKYIQKTDDYYNVITRIDNTLIYVSVNIDYKNDVNKVLNKLGY